jgi:hypothetical protein
MGRLVSSSCAGFATVVLIMNAYVPNPGRKHARSRRNGPTSAIRRFTGEFTGAPLLLARESALLLVVSTFDILMTYALLRQGFQFYESNPVARWWFVRWNMAGMTIFKFLVVTIAIVSCEVVERRRPGLGRGVMGLGILAAAVVVAYSVALFVRHVGPLVG